MNRIVKVHLTLISLLWLAQPAFAQSNEQAVPVKTRILFLLDGSGSMLASWEGKQTRMAIAKQLLAETVDSLQGNTNIELALRVYGHLHPSRYQHCKDSRLEVPFSDNNHRLIKEKLQTIDPKGTTPIAYSLEQSADDFPSASNVRNIIIVITDGIESCGGDPCAVSVALQRKQVFLKPFIIALGAEEGFEQQFECMGAYFDASSIARFRKALNTAIRQSLAKTTLSVELLNEKGQPTQKDINLSFVNSLTQEVVYNFVHYRDRQNKSDTLQVEPVTTYDLYVHTIPPLVRKNVALEHGRHNTIEIKVPQGSLLLTQHNHQEYNPGVQAVIRQVGSPHTLYVQPMGSSEKYLAGTYDLEVLTLPRTLFYKVKIEPGRQTTLELPAPGLLHVRADFVGIGDVYALKDGVPQQLIYKLNDKNPVNSLALQPGKYRLVFRARNAQGSRFTRVRNFEIKPGATTNINLFGK